MGMFDYTCSVSGLPIGEGTPVRFIALVRSPYYEEGKSVDELKGMWTPLAGPLQAVYDCYGSVKGWQPGPEADEFFHQLQFSVVERDVGENSVHDVAVRKDMSHEEYLMALWEGRILVRHHGAQRPVVQTMIREDVWQLLVGMEFIDDGHTYNLEWLRKHHHLHREKELELLMISVTFGRLGYYWRPGSCAGPQVGDFQDHRRFLQGVLGIAASLSGG